ncbi:PREDICTED: uncharacterized protein LOC106118051, partial [Papilio xuthus]|uniref:Uncharacterized protein LOC106118051 n=1 Tax=Papilio xuthus TaxID=66420 RepID=A0AAJ7E9F6_PAPXU
MDSMHLLLVLAMTTVMHLHALQLQELNKNPGILPVRQGTAVVSNKHWIIVKTLNFQPMTEDVKINVLKTVELNTLVFNLDKNFSYTFIDLKLQLDYIKNLTIDKLQQVTPSSRIKRGLLNPLGSLIKIITGNLDNDDAIRYDKIITQFKNNQNINNRKITLITEMVQTIANTTFKLNDNLFQINNAINSLSTNISILFQRERLNHIEIRIEADESFYFCPEDDTTQLIKDACITDLMMYAENISSCLPIPVDLEAVRVQLIQQNTWILYTKEPTLLTKLCTDEVSRQKIYGTYIITLDDNCSARIKDINLTRQPVENESSTYLKVPLINLPTINLPAEAPPLKPMNLKGIELTNLKLLSIALAKSDPENSESENSIVKIKS